MFSPRDDKFKIEDRSQLIYALTEAAALEHLLMCQYIYAAASLKTHLAELSNPDRRYYQLERIRYWKRKLYEVGREEMQHLAIAMNLLIAVGGAPSFSRPNFPADNQYYKTKTADGSVHSLEMSLERFSGTDADPFRTIDRFIRFEQPQVVPDRAALADALAAIPQPNLYDTVGKLYAAIREAFDHIPDVIIDVNDQYAPTDEDSRPVRLSGRPAVNAIARSPTEAKALIDQIVYQGEGYPDTRNDPRAHYAIFRRIRDEYAAERAADPHFEPARRCVPNPRVRADEVADRSDITLIDSATDGGLQFDLLQLFSGAYEVLIGFLSQLFAPIPAGTVPPAFRAIETLTFLPYMTEVIAPLAEVLSQVPVKSGSAQMLGAGFEVTSNDFLVPSLDVGTQLSLERIAALAQDAKAARRHLTEAGLKDQAEQLGFIAQTLEILASELKSRRDFGWPPARSQWDMTYSEIAPAAGDFNPSFKGYAMLELYFEGVVQCRLATDPDGAAVRRGVVGNGFAIGDEADLDRVIYFTPVGAYPRSHCPPIGVRVRSARLLRKSLATGREIGERVAEFNDATIMFINRPKFEGRNHVVSEDGEPIDPFELSISASNGIHLQRKAVGIAINDMTPVQRRGTGRYPSVGVSDDAMRRNLAIANAAGRSTFSTPLDYTRGRIADLEAEFEPIKGTEQAFAKKGAELEFRLRSLEEGLRDGQKLDARTIRWLRYFFDAAYRHFISGEQTVDFGPLASRFSAPRNSTGTPSDETRWLIDYHLGFFDTDAMTACMYGTVWVPVAVAN